jgi:hypothetical protein
MRGGIGLLVPVRRRRLPPPGVLSLLRMKLGHLCQALDTSLPITAWRDSPTARAVRPCRLTASSRRVLRLEVDHGALLRRRRLSARAVRPCRLTVSTCRVLALEVGHSTLLRMPPRRLSPHQVMTSRLRPEADPNPGT